MASPEEIWLVDFGEPFPGEPANHRPALVLGPSRLFGDNLPFVIVAPLTTTRRGTSFHVEIEPDIANGLRHVSYVQCELLRSVSRKRLTTQLGFVTVEQSTGVGIVVKRILDY